MTATPTKAPAGPEIETTPDMVRGVYKTLEKNLAIIRERFNRPLTLAEKILLGHLYQPGEQELEAGESYLAVRPDRVAMQDATAQMAVLQFMQAGKPSVAVPTTIHCDHLIQGHIGAISDLPMALNVNAEVYDFLGSAGAKYGMGFWEPGAGIIHQVVLEKYAFPGGLMIGTDSHTPNMGGLGMIAVGVGGADAVDVMAGFPWEVKYPKLIGVKLTGELNGWTAPKDVIVKLAGILTVKGATNAIVEYFGPGARTISATGKGTITNMGAEIGATTSIFPYDGAMERYMRATERADLADIANEHLHLVTADPEVEQNPEDYFDRIIEIDLSQLEPHVTGPHTPDLARTLTELKEAVPEEGYPEELSSALVGSCTNSSYEDIMRASYVIDQARERGVKVEIPFYITPGSEQIRRTIERDGLLDKFVEAGGTVLANACGPCIGQWKRDDIQPNGDADEDESSKNSIVTSFNRNFPRRNDGNPNTLAFITSPEVTVALGLAGKLTFNPLTDELLDSEGNPWKLDPPPRAPELPEQGFALSREGYVKPAEDPSKVDIQVDPNSERLQLLEPFNPWDGEDYVDLPLLLKADGKCTTDHISPAGPWLRFRGHLDNISNNMFIGAINAFTGEAGKAKNIITGEEHQAISDVARDYKARGLQWIVVGDENYGEGSSREHAAMEPRYLGAAAIIARSFARIHESNLKKQGVLPLTFVNPEDYNLIEEEDRISLVELGDLAPGESVMMRVRHVDGTTDIVELQHTLNDEQIEWFHAGSALNMIRRQNQ